MLTKVNFSCGHTEEVNLSNDEKIRAEKIKELEQSGLCPACRKAQYEKEDKENSKNMVCVRIKKDIYKEKFNGYAQRQTGFPKEKEYTYIFVPYEEVCVEAIKNMIEKQQSSFKEVVNKVEEEFAKKHPQLYSSLKPVALDDEDDIFNEPPVTKEKEPSFNPLYAKPAPVVEKESEPETEPVVAEEQASADFDKEYAFDIPLESVDELGGFTVDESVLEKVKDDTDDDDDNDIADFDIDAFLDNI